MTDRFSRPDGHYQPLLFLPAAPFLYNCLRPAALSVRRPVFSVQTAKSSPPPSCVIKSQDKPSHGDFVDADDGPADEGETSDSDSPSKDDGLLNDAALSKPDLDMPVDLSKKNSSALPLVLLRNFVLFRRKFIPDSNPFTDFIDSADYGEEKGTDSRPELKSLFNLISQLVRQRDLSEEQSDKDDALANTKPAELVENLAETVTEYISQDTDEEDVKKQVDSQDEQEVEKESKAQIVGQDDQDDDDFVPKTPQFDPVTGLVLAGYAFRAYLSPPAEAHREVHTTTVEVPSPEAKNGTERRTITTLLYYPHAPMIAVAATGVFTLSFEMHVVSNKEEHEHQSDKNGNENGNGKREDKDKAKNEKKKHMPFYMATVNGAVVTPTDVSSCSASVLRIREDAGSDRALDDVLRLSLYATRAAYDAVEPASHVATIPLADLVKSAVKAGKARSIEIAQLKFEALDEEHRYADFFHSSLLPKDIQLPSFSFVQSDSASDIPQTVLDSLSVSLRVVFVPFPPSQFRQAILDVGNHKGFDNGVGVSSNSMSAGKDNGNHNDDADVNEVSATCEKAIAEFRRATDSLNELSLDTDKLAQAAADLEVRKIDVTTSNMFGTALPKFQLPNPATALSEYFRAATRLPRPSEWARLSSACRTIVEAVGDPLLTERCSSLLEDAPMCLFVECAATDTQIALFRDDERKSIVISFRGTDQMSWRDMLTDAQLFLQLWTPGHDIVLDIRLDQTVGLPSFLPEPLRDETASPIPDDASAVHYGFLQAYMSVREALRHALAILTHGNLHAYMLHFTGHSLGGALATIASADFQALYQLNKLHLCCMTYGAPKVGNVNFARLFNELVPNAFRIVNDADAIARMPQSVRAEQSLSRYKHAGRTVLMNDEGELWIEGIHDKLLEDEDWTWRDGKDALQEMLKFEFNSWSEFFSSNGVKHHLVSLSNSCFILSSLFWDYQGLFSVM